MYSVCTKIIRWIWCHICSRHAIMIKPMPVGLYSTREPNHYLSKYDGSMVYLRGFSWTTLHWRLFFAEPHAIDDYLGIDSHLATNYRRGSSGRYRGLRSMVPSKRTLLPPSIRFTTWKYCMRFMLWCGYSSLWRLGFDTPTRLEGTVYPITRSSQYPKLLVDFLLTPP